MFCSLLTLVVVGIVLLHLLVTIVLLVTILVTVVLLVTILVSVVLLVTILVSIAILLLLLAIALLLAIVLAINFPDRIFNRVLFAWQALAAAFGPLLVVSLWRGPVRPAWRITALAVGFLLTVTLSWTVDSPGDWVERLVPLAIALGLAWQGSRSAQS